MSNEIVRCPLCDGELQATTKTYRSGIEVEFDAEHGSLRVTSLGWVEDENDDDVSLYCENDHDESAILAEVTRLHTIG